MCYAHGLQLVIHDIFYKKQTAIAEEQSDYLSETDEPEIEIDEMEDSDGITVVTAFGDQQVDSLMLNLDIFWISNKVRGIVEFFKPSPLKNEFCRIMPKKNIQTDCS